MGKPTHTPERDYLELSKGKELEGNILMTSSAHHRTQTCRFSETATLQNGIVVVCFASNTENFPPQFVNVASTDFSFRVSQ